MCQRTFVGVGSKAEAPRSSYLREGVRNPMPYRGFPTFMRSLSAIFSRRPKTRGHGPRPLDADDTPLLKARYVKQRGARMQ
jgi:hypothetical protein